MEIDRLPSALSPACAHSHEHGLGSNQHTIQDIKFFTMSFPFVPASGIVVLALTLCIYAPTFDRLYVKMQCL